MPIGLATGYPIEVVADFGRQSVRARALTMWVWSDPAMRDELDRHQFLQRSGFSPLVGWLARDAAAD